MSNCQTKLFKLNNFNGIRNSIMELGIVLGKNDMLIPVSVSLV